MSMHPLLLLCLLALACRTTTDDPEQGGALNTVPLTLEKSDSARATALFGDSLRMQVLFSGKDWLEGPLVLPDGDVICSDIPNNQILRWNGTGSEVYLERSGSVDDDYSREPGSNGLALDRQGRLLLCQHGARRVVRLDSDPGDPQPVFTVIADNYRGQPFNSPNDLHVASDGSILFTDPPYGLPEDESGDLGYYGVYRVDTLGEVTLLTKQFERPNGIALNLAEDRLLIAQSGGGRKVVVQIPYRPEEEYTGLSPIVLSESDYGAEGPGSPDGLELSPDNLLFATTPGGMCVVDMETLLVIARIGSDRPISNCTLSPDGRFLYLTNDDRLVRVELNPA